MTRLSAVDGILAVAIAIFSGSLVISGQAIGQTSTAERDVMQPKFGPSPMFPKGAEAALIHGSPVKAGLVVIHLRYPANYRLPAHSHPVDWVVTVLSGTYYAGVGGDADPSKTLPVKAGEVVIERAGVSHYAFTRDEGVTLVATAVGPVGTVYVNPKEDPRK